MTALSTNAQQMLEALAKVPASRPIKFIATSDYDLELVPLRNDVQIWADWNKTRSVTKALRQKAFNFRPAGAPVVNQHGSLMMPVYWGKEDQICWIDIGDFKPVVRLGVVNDAFAGNFVGDKGTWPCNPTARQLKVWETVQIIGETATHYQIGPEEWVLKEHVYIKP